MATRRRPSKMTNFNTASVNLRQIVRYLLGLGVTREQLTEAFQRVLNEETDWTPDRNGA